MPVGFPVNKSDIDMTLGQISMQLRDSIFRVPGVKQLLDTLTDTDLEARGYTADDVVLLRATLNDLYTIYLITTGQTVQAEAYDFQQNIGRTTGIA